MSGIATHGRPGKTQAIAFTATPANSTAFGSQTCIRLVATSACTVTISGGASAMYIAPNFPEVLLVTPGQSLSVVQVSANGNLFLTELE
jgi:hypothetical protein